MTVENGRPRINIGKVADWLAGRGASSECPFCRHTRWEAVNGSGHIGNAVPYGSDGKGDMYLGGYPILLLMCGKCNFVRPLALTPELQASVIEGEPSADQ